MSSLTIETKDYLAVLEAYASCTGERSYIFLSSQHSRMSIQRTTNTAEDVQEIINELNNACNKNEMLSKLEKALNNECADNPNASTPLHQRTASIIYSL